MISRQEVLTQDGSLLLFICNSETSIYFIKLEFYRSFLLAILNSESCDYSNKKSVCYKVLPGNARNIRLVH